MVDDDLSNMRDVFAAPVSVHPRTAIIIAYVSFSIIAKSDIDISHVDISNDGVTNDDGVTDDIASIVTSDDVETIVAPFAFTIQIADDVVAVVIADITHFVPHRSTDVVRFDVYLWWRRRRLQWTVATMCGTPL